MTRIKRRMIATAEATGQSRLREELVPQHLANHQRIRSAQERGDHKFTDDGDEDEEAARDNARLGQRQRHQPEGLTGVSSPNLLQPQEAKSSSFSKRGVDRQDHEGKVGIDDADIDGGVGVHE